MQVIKVTYERLHNLGNYENEKIGVEAVLNEGESVEDALRELKEVVIEQLALLNAKRVAPDGLFTFEGA